MGNVVTCDPTRFQCLTARLLGPVSLAVGDRTIPAGAWPRRGARDLLVLLLLSPGHRLSRERVFAALWPELPPDAARNAYYKALHALRHTLEPDLAARQAGSFVTATADAVALVAGSVALDVDRFEQLLDEARVAPAEQRLTLLHQALSLRGGDLLEDEPEREWDRPHRDRLHRAWQGAACGLAGLELAGGGPQGSVALLEALLAADPTHEEANRLLIRAYDRRGQRDMAVRQYERCVAALRDELGVDPSNETLRLGAGLLGPELPERARRRRQRSWAAVPAPPSRLIGREQELEEVRDLLTQMDVRLVTLIGPGGVGKTRLAIDVANQVEDELGDGACFVSLAPVRDAGLVLPTLVHALGLREETADTPLDQISHVLQDREALLVLDNFEHVLAAAPALADILAACPGVTMLATSREPLHLRSERLVEILPLDVPEREGDNANLPSLATLARAAAVTLFVERAAAVSPDFHLSESNAADVVGICARLDGLPLAIELAAARSRELPPGQLLDVLSDRMAVLVDGYQDLPPRQRTIRDTIAWSHDLLDDQSQILFRRLAVFAGGSTPEIVARLAGTSEAEAETRLQMLCDKSLLRGRTTGAVSRAEMLETTRDFGLERLAAAGETELARDVLVAHAVALTTNAAEHLSGPEQAVWLDRLDADRDNLREALAWTIERDEAEQALTLGGSLWRYWWSRGYLSEGRDWLERALALPGPVDQSLRGAAINGAASLAESQGDFVRAAALHAEALALWRDLGAMAGVARALSGLGTAAAHRGDYETARDFHERALVLVRQAGDLPGMARTLDRLGTVGRHQGDFDRAETCYGESLEIFRASGDLVNASIVLSNLGEVVHQQGRAERAAELYEEALRPERELDLPDGVAFDLTNLARVRLELGELERAEALGAQGIRLFRDLGNQLGLARALAVFGMTARARADPLRAGSFLGESLRILAELGERSSMPEHLEQLAAVLLDLGQTEPAVRLLGAADGLREQIASPLSAIDRGVVDETLEAARARLGPQGVARAFEAGHTLPLDRVLADVP